MIVVYGSPASSRLHKDIFNGVRSRSTVNIAMNPYILVYWSASDGMAFKYLLVLRTPLRTSPDSDCAYRQNTAYPLPASLSA